MFLNRRGYAPVLHCGDCGWKSGCPHCSAWRVFHKLDRTLRCHHCGLAERVPRACPTAATPTSRRSAAAPSGSRSSSPALLPEARHRPHRRRQHAQQGRARGAARRGARGRGRRPGRHADDRQGPRLSAHHPGRGGQPRQLAVQQRLPRAGAAVRAADAGRRPRRPRRRPGGAERDVGADLAPGPSALRRRWPARLRGVRRQPARGARSGRPAAVLAPRDAARRARRRPRRRAASSTPPRGWRRRCRGRPR